MVENTIKNGQNRLRNTFCYLSGAMDRVKDGGEQWRDEFIRKLSPLGIKWHNPCNKPFDTGIEDTENRKKIEIYKENGDWDAVDEAMNEIRHIDLRMVDWSHWLIVNLDLDVHPCGTYEELFLANNQVKPIIVHCVQGKRHIPNWMFNVLPHQMMFGNWCEVYEYIYNVDSGADKRTFGRWLFYKPGFYD